MRSVGGAMRQTAERRARTGRAQESVHAGHRLGVVPDHLFYYRHRPGGFSRSTNWFANHRAASYDSSPTPAYFRPRNRGRAQAAFLGFHQELEHRDDRDGTLRHRLADQVHSAVM